MFASTWMRRRRSQDEETERGTSGDKKKTQTSKKSAGSLALQHHLEWWRRGRGKNIKQHRLTNTSHIPALLHTTGSSHSHCLHCTKEPCVHQPPLLHPSHLQAAFSSTGLSTSDSHPPLALARSFSSAPDFQSVHPDYRGSENMCQALFLAEGSPV